jgi:hypothetical protein
MLREIEVQKVLRLGTREGGAVCTIELEDDRGQCHRVNLSAAVLEVLMLPLQQLLDQTQAMPGRDDEPFPTATAAAIDWHPDGVVSIDFDVAGGYRETIKMPHAGAAALGRVLCGSPGHRYVSLQRDRPSGARRKVSPSGV